MVLPQACPGFSFLLLGGYILSMMVSGLTALRFVGGFRVSLKSRLSCSWMLGPVTGNLERTSISNSVTSEKEELWIHLHLFWHTIKKKSVKRSQRKEINNHQTAKDLSCLQIISPQLSSEQNFVFGFNWFKMIHSEPEVKSRKSKWSQLLIRIHFGFSCPAYPSK